VAAQAEPHAAVADFEEYLEKWGEWLLGRDGLENKPPETAV